MPCERQRHENQTGFPGILRVHRVIDNLHSLRSFFRTNWTSSNSASKELRIPFVADSRFQQRERNDIRGCLGGSPIV